MCQQVLLFLCENMEKENNCNVSEGRAMSEEAFEVVEMHVSLEAARGMMAANGDELTIVVFVLCESV